MFIRLNSLTIFAHHCVYDEEIKNGNHFEIDLEVEVPDTVGVTTDMLSDTLDYSKLSDTVAAVSENRRYHLLEAFACDICEKILEIFPAVGYAGVKVRKLNPPMRGNIKNIEVEFQKRRTNA